MSGSLLDGAKSLSLSGCLLGVATHFILVLLVHDFKIKPSNLITMKLVFQNKESLNFHCARVCVRVSEGTTYVEPILSLLLEGQRDLFWRPFRLTLLVFLREEMGYCCQDTLFQDPGAWHESSGTTMVGAGGQRHYPGREGAGG